MALVYAYSIPVVLSDASQKKIDFILMNSECPSPEAVLRTAIKLQYDLCWQATSNREDIQFLWNEPPLAFSPSGTEFRYNLRITGKEHRYIRDLMGHEHSMGHVLGSSLESLFAATWTHVHGGKIVFNAPTRQREVPLQRYLGSVATS